MHVASSHCARSRANRVFGADEKRIRTKNTVMDKSNRSLGLLLYKIVDPRGRAAVRASSIAAARCIFLHMRMSACDHCALRAPTLFSGRMKSTSVRKTGLGIKATTAWRCYFRNKRNSATTGGAIYVAAYKIPGRNDI